MPADQFLPAHDGRRPGAHPLPTLTGDEPGLSRVRAALQRCGPKEGAGAPLTQAGAPAPDTVKVDPEPQAAAAAVLAEVAASALEGVR